MTTTRTSDRDVIEHRLLELAYTTDAKITAAALAYFAPCSFEDAESVLDALTARERIRMDIEDDGTIIYMIPDRQRMPARPESARPEPAPRAQQEPAGFGGFGGFAGFAGFERAVPRFEAANQRGLVRQVQQPLTMRAFRGASPTAAAVLSMFIPGAGQLYAGRWVSAFLWFMVVGAGYALVLPGLVLHLFCVISAASSAHRLNASLARLQLAA